MQALLPGMAAAAHGGSLSHLLAMMGGQRLASAFGNMFESNSFFSAGVSLFLLNFAVKNLSWLLVYIYSYLTSRLTYTITISGKDDVFCFVKEWYYEKAKEGQIRNFNVTSVKSEKGRQRELDKGNGRDRNPTVNWNPGPGTHYIPFEGRLLCIKMINDPGVSVVDGVITAGQGEKLTVTVYGGSKKLLERFVKEAVDLAVSSLQSKTLLYKVNSRFHPMGWSRFAIKDRRALDSVILDGPIADNVFKDIDRFVNSKQWYVDRGIPYQRGYLLYGPPGTGKTSFIQAVAGSLGKDLAVLQLSTGNLTDNTLGEALNAFPENSIVVLEDVDAAFAKRSSANEKSSLTFSGLLNALDGIGAADGRILFMTTNYHDKLSPALVRPGRVDMRIRLDYASSDQIKRMFKRFFDGEGRAEQTALADIVNIVEGGKVSPAQLQDWFITHRDDPAALSGDAARFLDDCVRENARTDNLNDVTVEEKKADQTATISI